MSSETQNAMAKSRKRGAADNKARDELAEVLRNLTDDELVEFERQISTAGSKRDRARAFRLLRRENERRAKALRRYDDLLNMANGRVDLSRRRGKHRTLLGDDPWQDRNARIAIIRMYRRVLSILRGEPRDESDSRFVPNWLHGYLMHEEGVPKQQARESVRKALEAVETEGQRGPPSQARRIVREFVGGVGVGVLDRPRLRIQLTDHHLRKILNRGDPLLLPPREAAKARHEAARCGVKMEPGGVTIASEKKPGGLHLVLERRRKPDGTGLQDRADLVLYKGGEFKYGTGRISLDDETPFGRAGDVLRNWLDNAKRTDRERQLAKMFLKRRR